ncbi:hypothetical protein PRIPAC_88567 [Pristionchus pacificus]|uniref:Uncharacterized protein n=1 Tax=Pristionchus pacificus TaxID=54126 RepID=A0A2A6CXG9_PRIPA|nr:hypothetical protein PRIPAC_88567 [Pristionchus pacificus]|eukprot:PDM82828.1 hypothetical protein PRIPAC_37221 [Pristionchus pacificus]
MKMDHLTYTNITKAQQRKRLLFLHKNDVVGASIDSHLPKRRRLQPEIQSAEQRTVISANEEAMEVNVDENNNVPEEKIHYFGPGRSWSASWIYKSKDDLKKDVIQWEMTVFKSKCRIDEADRIEANAHRAIQDGYFDQSDVNDITKMCSEMRLRGGPSLDEVLVYLEEWRQRMGDSDAAPFILPCGQRLGSGDSHDCKGSKGKNSLIHQKWIGH